MNPPFKVELDEFAEDQLAEIWGKASDREEINLCEQAAYKNLQRFPDTAGKYHAEGLYTIDSGILRFCYQIDFIIRKVYILEIIQISWDEENI
jgi:hypothetical protein